MTQEAIDDPRVGPVLAAVDDVTICVLPDAWRSWKVRDIDGDGRFFGGILGRTPERWFLPLD